MPWLTDQLLLRTTGAFGFAFVASGLSFGALFAGNPSADGRLRAALDRTRHDSLAAWKSVTENTGTSKIYDTWNEEMLMKYWPRRNNLLFYGFQVSDSCKVDDDNSWPAIYLSTHERVRSKPG
jgi:hypothetical protein